MATTATSPSRITRSRAATRGSTWTSTVTWPRTWSSTNGTFVNDTPAKQTPLADGDYLRVGNCLFRFLAGGNVEADYHEELYRLAILDALTGLYNKRYLMDYLQRELDRSARYSRPLALILFDIDHFKSINDTHGPPGRGPDACASWRVASGPRSARTICWPATVGRNSRRS